MHEPLPTNRPTGSETGDLTGLFLGAGTSYEVGMPLISGLTGELTNWLTPEKLKSLNQTWRVGGLGFSDAIIDDFARVLTSSDQHYESMLGYLETQYMRRHATSASYHHLYSWLVEMVYFLLYSRHVNNIDYIDNKLKYYAGLSELTERNRPLWIFSLNHDLLVECLALRIGCPLRAGFTEEVVSLPMRDEQGKVTGHLQAEVLSGSSLEDTAMPFFQSGSRGINLLKIHGSLDVFTFRDGKDLLRILPAVNTVRGQLESLRDVNEKLVTQPTPVSATNEIIYYDRQDEMQFLRRSLLAGAYKFDQRTLQVLPRQLLRHFESYINFLQSLVCIGYGFGDSHINEIIRRWLEFSENRSLVIVDPSASAVPELFLHLAQQVEVRSMAATEYLDSVAGIVRSEREKIERKWIGRLRRHREGGVAELRRFVQQEVVGDLITWLSTIPIRDGDIDLESIGMSLEDLVDEANRRVPTLEEVVQRFLENEDDP